MTERILSSADMLALCKISGCRFAVNGKCLMEGDQRNVLDNFENGECVLKAEIEESTNAEDD